jgi:hypothetical protein
MRIQQAQSPVVTSYTRGGKTFTDPKELVKDAVVLTGRTAAQDDPKAQVVSRTRYTAPYSLAKTIGTGVMGGAIGAGLGTVAGVVVAVFCMFDFPTTSMKVGAALGGALGALSGALGGHDEQTVDYRQSGYMFQENGKAWFEAHPQDSDDIYYGMPRFELASYPVK